MDLGYSWLFLPQPSCVQGCKLVLKGLFSLLNYIVSLSYEESVVLCFA